MTARNLILILLIGLAQLSDAQEEVLSPRIANYEIDLVADVDEKKIRASEILIWKNPGSTPVNTLQFHLYYNAFKNTKSTFMKERGLLSLLNPSEDGQCGWAYLQINDIKDEAGNDLTASMKFIQPDDDNIDDQSVLEVTLATPVQPGQSIKVFLNWESKIPNIMPRTGYNKEFYFMAQWFPKVGVYETKGMRGAAADGWNCHQYHSSGEYYADFGNYKVSMTVPSNYIVGSSGELTEKKELGAQTKWTYEVNDVIDFTWTMSPHFVIAEKQWKHVHIKLLTYPEHVHFQEVYLQTAINALSYLDEHLGKYPYPTLTIVDPPIHGIFTGGMEYPTLISTFGFSFIPEGIKIAETLIVHEFVHQYFMQMVATHEVEEPWMDEGFTTYWEGKIMDHFEGADCSAVNFCGIKIGNAQYNRAEFLGSGNTQVAPGNTMSWKFEHGGYGDIAYNKTAMWLKTLEGLVGAETMNELMRTYFERWKFKHPNGQDFINVVNEIVRKNHGDKFGENLDWFFDQVLYGTQACDYKVASINNREKVGAAGFIEDLENCDRQEMDENIIESSVILNRIGDMTLPIEVKINFEDGTSILEEWDGISRTHEFKYEGSKEIVSAEIDPDHKIDMDTYLVNNSLTTKEQTTGIRKYLVKFMVTMQHVMQSLTAFI